MAVEKAIPAAKQRFRRECHVVKRSSVSSDRFHAMKNLIDNAQNSDNFVQQALGILSPLSSWTFPDMNHELKAGDGKVTQADILKGRGIFQEGGDVDSQVEMMLGDKTYSQEMQEELEPLPELTMLPDEQMEEDYVDYVVQETLSNQDRNYLIDAIEKDVRLS